jgi:peptidoglycan/xylan/chitin deacetylase (PgdA/CDA1 family)
MFFLKRKLRKAGPVLLYHATFSIPPDDLGKDLHNVAPEVFRKHCLWLKKHYSVVSLDELAEAKSRHGLAAISFDDAYRCIFTEAWPILSELELPATVFVNGCTLKGKPFWRDKVRLIINRGWVVEFENFCQGMEKDAGQEFYRYTKNPRNNSRIVDSLLDEFLASRDVKLCEMQYCASGPDELVRDPLITYGNHTENHYVMSSLTRDEQRLEIEQTQKALETIEGINLSSLFSVPFGANPDLNDDTLMVALEAGYTSLVMSRSRLNLSPCKHLGVSFIERFMPDETSLKEQINARMEAS